MLQLDSRLMDCGGARLAAHCTLSMIKECHPWVAAVTKVEMVRLRDSQVGLKL